MSSELQIQNFLLQNIIGSQSCPSSRIHTPIKGKQTRARSVQVTSEFDEYDDEIADDEIMSILTHTPTEIQYTYVGEETTVLPYDDFSEDLFQEQKHKRQIVCKYFSQIYKK